MTTKQKLELIQAAVEEKKAVDIVTLDLEGKTLLADYFVIASGNSTPHIRSIVDGVIEKLKAQSLTKDHVEGYQDAQWVLLDYGDIVVHVFNREIREFYDLEALWDKTQARVEEVRTGGVEA